MSGRRYFVRAGGRKYYIPAGLVETAADLRAVAQNAANRLGQAVTVGWDAGPRRRVMRRNPLPTKFKVGPMPGRNRNHANPALDFPWRIFESNERGGKRTVRAFKTKEAAQAALAGFYQANPVNPHLKAASLELLSFLRGRDITADQARRIRQIAAKAKPKRKAALPKAAKGAKRAPSRDAAAARRAGYARSDNPYEPGTMGHRLWDQRFAD